MRQRPPFIRNWRELQPSQEYVSPATSEGFGYPADFGRATGLSRLKLLHLTLPPGRRTNAPGAYRDEEEFFFVLEGAPDLWCDGYLHRLREGDGVSFNDRTGISHTLINNSDGPVRLFAFGEATRVASQFHVALKRDDMTAAALAKLGKLWTGAPMRRLGPHDGLSDRARGGPLPQVSRKSRKPTFARSWRDIIANKSKRYDNSNEDQGIDASFGRLARFSRIGIHLEVLKPGRRTSFPHAERDEDEFVFVVAGSLDCWLDGNIHPITEGDFVGWEGGTGITHVVMNNSGKEAILLVGGEASRMKNQFWYPYHPSNNKAVGMSYWADHPNPKLGPHDGLPDSLRERLPPRARKSALAANIAALNLKPPGKKRRR